MVSSITNLLHELPHELPNDFKCPHKKKKKTWDLRKLGNLRKISNLGGNAV